MNQKLEAELNLSLSLSEEEREKSPLLNAGYEKETGLWKMILLYQGAMQEVADALSITFIPLLGNFAIIEVRENQILELAAYPQVLYLELSRPLYLSEITGMEASCFRNRPVGVGDSISAGENAFLTGKGVVVAILDSGVDYRHPDFRTAEGTTRILAYWDQTVESGTGNSYQLGTIFSEEMLNNLLMNPEGGEARPSPDNSGHGTHVAGICAGNGRSSGGRNQGAAPEASLLVVKLKNEASSIYTDYANLMMAMDFCVRFAANQNLPLSVNISYGSNDGSHDGNSLIESFFEQCMFYGKNTIVIATGNEGITRRHTEILLESNQNSLVAFSVAPNERSLYVQGWKSFTDRARFEVILPNQNYRISLPEAFGIYQYELGGARMDVAFSEPTPYQVLQQFFLSISPSGTNTSIPAGIWHIGIAAGKILSGRMNWWLPVREATNTATGFQNPVIERTFTVPSTAARIISVSGYDSTTDVFASFSGRGFVSEETRESKPDLTAPAVNILSTAPGGGYSIKTGTSMAAPFVTGACALLMQYGITEGRDPFLFGEKVRAYLICGARQLPGYDRWPNAQAGWGALCVRDSLPE